MADIEEPKKKRGRKPKTIEEDTLVSSKDTLVSSKDTLVSSKDTLEPIEEKSIEKPTTIEESVESEPIRRRGRKKKYAVESIKKLRENMTSEDKVVFHSNNDHLASLDNQMQVSFGSLNITVHNSNPIDKHELRKKFDNDFNLSNQEKVPNILLQENGERVFLTKKPKKEIDIFSFLNRIPEEDIENSENSFNETIKEPIKEPEPINKTNEPETTTKKIPKSKIHKMLKHFVNDQEISDTNVINHANDVIKNLDLLTSPLLTSASPLLCWHCCHTFDNEPIVCPYNYDASRNRFLVKGNFCSWACASAYSIDTYKSLSYIYQMLRQIDPNTEDPEMIVAPSRFCLKSFGGPMTISEFRLYKKDPTKLYHDIKISTEHISYVNQEILETYMENTKVSKKN